MIAQIKAELLKIRSTRTTVGLVLAMVALDSALHAAQRAAQPPERPREQGGPA